MPPPNRSKPEVAVRQPGVRKTRPTANPTFAVRTVVLEMYRCTIFKSLWPNDAWTAAGSLVCCMPMLAYVWRLFRARNNEEGFVVAERGKVLVGAPQRLRERGRETSLS
jgi:hypothetical protein